MQLVSNYLYSILSFTYLYLIGSILVNKLKLQLDIYTNVFFSTTAGLFISINFLIIISSFNFLTTKTIIIALAISTLFIIRNIKKNKQIYFNPSLIIYTLIVLLFCAFVSTKYPGHWDDTMYHLPIARWYLEHQNLSLNPFLRFPLFPQNMDILIAGGLALGDTFVAQFLCTLPLALIAFGLISISQRYTQSISIGVVSFVCLLGSKPFATTIGYAYIDFGLALFCFSSIICLSLIDKDNSNQSKNVSLVFLSGFFSAAAIGTKLFGVFFCFFCFLYLLVFIREKKYLFTWTITILIFGSFWYIRSLIISGDPISPAGGDFFGYFLWNKEDLAFQKWEQSTHGVNPKSLDIIGALRSAGVLFTALFITLFIFRKKINKEIFLYLFVTTLYLCFWFAFTQVDRYLSPILPLLFFLSFYALHLILSTLFNKILYNQLYLLTIALLLAISNQQNYTAIFNPVFYNKNYLYDRPGYSIFQEANKNIGHLGPNLIHMGFENSIYFYNGVAIGDWFGIGRYRELADCDVPHCSPFDENIISEIMKSKFHAKQLAISKERSPLFNPKKFENNFNLIFEDNFGYLFSLKSDSR